jgi:hypothetical protein
LLETEGRLSTLFSVAVDWERGICSPREEEEDAPELKGSWALEVP